MLHWLHAFNRQSLDHITVEWPGKEVGLCSLMFIGGGLPLVLMGRWLLLYVFGLAAFLIWSEVYLSYWRQKYQIVAELVEVFVLCLLAPSAYYVSTGRLDRIALTLFVLCTVYFSVTVCAVRLRIAQIRAARGGGELDAVDERYREFWIVTVTSSVAVLLLMAQHWIRPIALLAFTPLLLRIFGPEVLEVSSPRYIRSLGWREVWYSIGFALATVLLV